MARAIILDDGYEEQTEEVNEAPAEEAVEAPEEALEETVEDTPEEHSEALTEPPETPEEDVPEKYRGKSLQDLVKMNIEAEKHIGRQSSEVGELRRLADQFIQSQSTQQKAPESAPSEEPDDIDYFTDPQAAIDKAIANHPKVREAEQYTATAREQAAKATIANKHPDMLTIVEDPKFQSWVTESRFRTQMFLEADQHYNVEAANELFSTWKQLNNMATQAAVVEKQARKKQVKAASTGSKQTAPAGKSRKIYRRADIIKLMIEDPARYEALQPELQKAYEEDRVK